MNLINIEVEVNIERSPIWETIHFVGCRDAGDNREDDDSEFTSIHRMSSIASFIDNKL